MREGRRVLLVVGILAVASILVFALARPLQRTPPGRAGQPGDPADLTRRLRPPTEDEIERARAAGEIAVIVMTEKGDIHLSLRGDLVPLTVANFLKLAEAGFYDGLTFHRVEDWVIQGGDPRGDGTGGPGYRIPLEVHPDLRNRRGAVAMARSRDPDSAGSQFYILKRPATWLDGEYAVFGRVTEGMDVVDRIEAGDRITRASARR